MKQLTVAALIAVSALGCSRAHTIDVATPAPATCTDVGDGLYDCKLIGGIRCVVYNPNGYMGGVTCDFKERAVER